jgi:hypothetical protein
MSGRKQLCVYTHSANSKVFYVGQGSQTRAYAKTPRPPAWKSHVGVVGKYDVNIVHWADDRDEAVRLESELIAAHPEGLQCREVR